MNEKRDVAIHESMPTGWEFNQDVTDVFDEMLSRSIPQYDVMRKAVFDVGAFFVSTVEGVQQKRGEVVDLGTSRGEAIDPLLKRFGAATTYLCVESSAPMIAAFKARYGNWIESGIVRLAETDLRNMRFGFMARASLVQSVLTLMFTPINYRQSIVENAYQALVPGGAFVLVEKVLGEGGQLDALEVELYHAMKAANGYTQEEIDRKRLALEGVQVPVTARWNQEMLQHAGFRQVDCFWRWMNFAAWVAVK